MKRRKIKKKIRKLKAKLVKLKRLLDEQSYPVRLISDGPSRREKRARNNRWHP